MGTQLHFADCELDAERRLLRRGGRAVPLEPRVFDLLLELIRQRHRVVPRAELLETIWQGRAVSRSALNVCMSRLRLALGDREGGESLLRAFPRYGYRFVGPVRELPSGVRATALFGRDSELAVLASLLADACEGRGATLVVRGEAGIGKTVLVDAFVARATAHGVPVLRGFCDEVDDAPALWPWVQIARQLDTHVSDAGSDRTARLDALCAAVLARAATAPLAVVIEDLQWADPDSLVALRHLARHAAVLPLLIVATQRQQASQPAAEISAAQCARLFRLELTGLDRRSVAALVTSVTGTALPAPQVDALLAATAGHPLFVRELAPLAKDGGGSRRIPEIVADLLRLDLRDITPGLRAMLTVAAVAGECFSGAALRPHLLEEAQRRSYIQPLSEDGYRFRLPLLRSYLAERLPPSQRRRLTAFWAGVK